MTSVRTVAGFVTTNIVVAFSTVDGMDKYFCMQAKMGVAGWRAVGAIRNRSCNLPAWQSMIIKGITFKRQFTITNYDLNSNIPPNLIDALWML